MEHREGLAVQLLKAGADDVETGAGGRPRGPDARRGSPDPRAPCAQAHAGQPHTPPSRSPGRGPGAMTSTRPAARIACSTVPMSMPSHPASERVYSARAASWVMMCATMPGRAQAPGRAPRRCADPSETGRADRGLGGMRGSSPDRRSPWLPSARRAGRRDPARPGRPPPRTSVPRNSGLPVGAQLMPRQRTVPIR